MRSTHLQCRPCILPLGGFLGAGKTSLIIAATRLLHARGLKAAAILKVDAHFAQANGVRNEQVSGGCFCCRFSDLIDAAERLSADAPDEIFIKAVGSCTDISDTVIQPLKQGLASPFRLAPCTVLIDSKRDEGKPNAPVGLAKMQRTGRPNKGRR